LLIDYAMPSKENFFLVEEWGKFENKKIESIPVE
jgi:hypothetical protein